MGSQRFLLFLSLLIAPLDLLLVCGQAMPYICVDNPCYVTQTTSCSSYAYDFDFSGCCSLSDADNGGCTLTVTPGGCSQIGRTSSCNPVDQNAFDFTCIGGLLIGYIFMNYTDAKEECPASAYDDVTSRKRSKVDTLPGLSMTLTGKSAFLSQEEISEWQDITASHTVNYIQDVLGMPYFDLITYVRTNYALGNAPTKADPGSDQSSMTIHYLQQISWRDPNMTVDHGSYFRSLAFDGTSAREAYLESLKAGSGSDAFASVTEVSVSGPQTISPYSGVPTTSPSSAPLVWIAHVGLNLLHAF